MDEGSDSGRPTNGNEDTDDPFIWRSVLETAVFGNLDEYGPEERAAFYRGAAHRVGERRGLDAETIDTTAAEQHDEHDARAELSENADFGLDAATSCGCGGHVNAEDDGFPDLTASDVAENGHDDGADAWDRDWQGGDR